MEDVFNDPVLKDKITQKILMYRPTAKGYFSGCGGMEIGIMQAGVNMIQSLDLDIEATDCMQMNNNYFSHAVINGDIKDKTVLEQPNSEIIIGTYPCAKYSAIADIHGTRTGDDLFLHFFRHIAIERPEMYIVENVPGMKKFKVVMEAMTKLPDYYVNVFCPVDAANWLPQRRKRLILIGTRKPFNISSPKSVISKPRLNEIIEKNPEVEMPEYVISRINGKYRDKPIIVDPEEISTITNFFSTLLKRFGHKISKRQIFKIWSETIFNQRICKAARISRRL